MPETPSPDGNAAGRAGAASSGAGFRHKLQRALQALNLRAQNRRIEAAEQLLLQLAQAASASATALSQAITGLQGEMEQLRDQRLPPVELRLDRIEQDLRLGQQEAGQLRTLLGQDAERFDRLEQALGNATSELGRLRDEALPAAHRRADLLIDRLCEELDEQASLVERLLLREPLPVPTGAAEHESALPDALAAAVTAVQPLLDEATGDGGDTGDAGPSAHRLDALLPLLEGQAPVLDLAAGRGELLQLLREAAIEATGIEADPALAQAARRRGLRIVEGPLPAVLADLAKAGAPPPYGAVVACHLLDRLPPATTLQTLAQVAQLLRPGGLLVVRSLNPATLRVAAELLWLDPRRRPLPLATLRRYLQVSGLAVTRCELLNPFPVTDRLLPAADPSRQDGGHPGWQELRQLQERLDELLNGPRLIQVLAVKPDPAAGNRPAEPEPLGQGEQA